MDYIVGTIKEDLLATIGMVGEIDYKCYMDGVSYNTNFLRLQIRNLVKQGILLKTQVDAAGKRNKSLRLSVPGGHEALSSYATELAAHLDLLERTGDPAGNYIHLYKGNSAYREKRFLKAAGMLKLISLPYCDIDFIRTSFEVDYRKGWSKTDPKISEEGYSVFNADGSVRTLEEILEHIRYKEDNNLHFISSRVILKKFQEEAYFFLKEINRTASIGALVKGVKLFPVYYTPAIKKGWKHSSEATYLSYLREALRTSAPCSQTDCDPFFLLENVSEIKDCLNSTGLGAQIDKSISLGNTAYLIPTDINYGNVLLLALDKALEEEILKSVLGLDYIETTIDYRIGEIDRVPVYSLLDCDLRKMQNLLASGATSGAYLIIHQWQEELAAEFYPETKNTIILTDKAVTDFIYSDKREEDNSDENYF